MDVKKLRRLPKDADLSRIHPDLRVLAVPISALTAHPGNPRNHPDANRSAIRGSLSRYQQRKNVVANNTDEGLRIEAGHGVYGEMLAIGAEYIACAIMGDDPVTELGFMIADNRTGDLSDDDPARLAPILKQLMEEGEAIEEIGWDDAAVAELMGKADSDPGTGGDGDGGQPNLDPGDGRYKEQYGVIVVLADAREQEAAFNELTALGYKCKIVVT